MRKVLKYCWYSGYHPHIDNRKRNTRHVYVPWISRLLISEQVLHKHEMNPLVYTSAYDFFRRNKIFKMQKHICSACVVSISSIGNTKSVWTFMAITDILPEISEQNITTHSLYIKLIMEHKSKFVWNKVC